MATEKLSKWASSLQWQHIPAATQTAAINSLYNYIGCGIHGSAHPTVTKATTALTPFFGKPTSTVLGSRTKADAQHAALLNGIASHVHDYDDTHLETIIHPTGPVASALLAFAQIRPGISGTSLLTALTAGIEAECKLGLAVWPSHYDVGWHITSTTGSIGAAVAVSKLMALSPSQTAHAIGLAAVQVTGLREMFGSDCKSFHVGAAARAGLTAALLAEQGFTSSEKALEAKRGWANVVVCGGKPRLDELVGSFGEVWETAKNAFKPFPCGIVKHPAIDAAVQMREKLGQRDVRGLRFSAKVHPLVIELTSKEKPRDGLEAKFSVFHGVAVGLLYGKAGPGEYADEVVERPEVVAVRDSVKAEKSDSIRSDEAILTAVDEKDEVVAEVHVERAVGSLEKPLDKGRLEEKFIDQVSLSLGSEKAKKMSDIAWSIERADDINDLIAQLQGS